MTAATMVEATQRAKAKIQSVLDYAHQLETDPQQEEPFFIACPIDNIKNIL